jgi:hypothetical protein
MQGRVGAIFYEKSDDLILSVLGSPVEGSFTGRVSRKQATKFGLFLETEPEYGSTPAWYHFGYARGVSTSGNAVEQRFNQCEVPSSRGQIQRPWRDLLRIPEYLHLHPHSIEILLEGDTPANRSDSFQYTAAPSKFEGIQIDRIRSDIT